MKPSVCRKLFLMLGGLLVAAVGCVDESQDSAESVEDVGEALLLGQEQHMPRSGALLDEPSIDRGPFEELEIEEVTPLAPGSENSEPEPIPWLGPKPDPGDDDTVHTGLPT